VPAGRAATARERVEDLIAWGVQFDRRDGAADDYDLHREGGHSARRILHAKDLTGAEIMRALVERVRAHPAISLRAERMGIDLITEGWLARRQGELPPHPERVLGAYVLDTTSGAVEAWSARVVALCTGGAGKVYLYTSNPDEASGDGIAMAYRAGARVANMEFVQFHPTCLYHPDARNFLISEALRGEGGRLVLRNGERFMRRYDERLELAPRDIVARAIDAELKRTGADCVYLDMRHLGRPAIEDKFPNIHARCLELGIDMGAQPIPVVPAAHYFCGGVHVDLAGESSVQNLFAIGETACTGLHGANRLASNSLLEAISYAHCAAEAICARLAEVPPPPPLPSWDPGRSTEPDELVVIAHTWDEIRRFMWNYVGIVRTSRRLRRAAQRIQFVQEEIRNYYWDHTLSGDLVELRNLATVAELVIECALRRRESRGLHFTLDYPDTDPRFLRDTVVQLRL
jgi:L-aspartate oxidase